MYRNICLFVVDRWWLFKRVRSTWLDPLRTEEIRCKFKSFLSVEISLPSWKVSSSQFIFNLIIAHPIHKLIEFIHSFFLGRHSSLGSHVHLRFIRMTSVFISMVLSSQRIEAFIHNQFQIDISYFAHVWAIRRRHKITNADEILIFVIFNTFESNRMWRWIGRLVQYFESLPRCHSHITFRNFLLLLDYRWWFCFRTNRWKSKTLTIQQQSN